jgi:hypothetical protein
VSENAEEDPQRLEATYAEIVFELAKYSNYLRRQWDPSARGIGKRIQDEIRKAFKEAGLQ